MDKILQENYLKSSFQKNYLFLFRGGFHTNKIIVKYFLKRWVKIGNANINVIKFLEILDNFYNKSYYKKTQ